MTKHATPALTADIIIELLDDEDRPIILIERLNPPYGWAIPGGFADVGERIEATAVREAKEEVCLDVTLKALLGLYSDPKRDQRGHTVTAVYVAEAHGMPCPADDAKNLIIIHPDKIDMPLAFDHAQVLADYRNYRNNGAVTPLRFEP
ncbi:MAG: NUDIX hydrolase [Magnetococcales bacterium]|nr:NUDIX hydrolase [Magnetococcales bacterium]